MIDGAEQVLEPVVAPVRVALEVEVDVARRRRREPAEPAVVLGLEQLIKRGVQAAAAQLQVGLAAQVRERVLGELGDRDGVVEPGQGGDVVHALGLDQQALAALEARHQRDVILAAALVSADLPPRAEVARGDRVRVDRLCAGLELGLACQERGADPRGIGGEVGGVERGLLVVAEDQVHALRTAALQALEFVGVEQELEDVAGLSVAAELRVVDLVGPVAQIGGHLDPDQEIRVADPLAVVKAPLVDHVIAGAHRVNRPIGTLCPRRRRIVQRDHAETRGPHPLEHPVLEHLPAFQEQLQLWRLALGVELTAALEHVEVGAVLAVEKAVEGAR